MITCKEDLKGKYVITRDEEVLQAFCKACARFGLTTASGKSVYLLGLEKDTIAYDHAEIDSFIKGTNINNFYKDEGLVPFTLDDLKLEPIWNNKRPSEMSKEEFASFVYDRIVGVDMQILDNTAGWVTVAKNICDFYHKNTGFSNDNVYRVKPPLTKDELRYIELEESIALKRDELTKLLLELEEVEARL